jgi:hypothetical protein
MRLYVLVEGPSEEALLRGWLPRLLPAHTFKIIKHRGKGAIPGDPSRILDPRRQGLLDQLPAKLRAYGQSLNPDTDRVAVLVDLDTDDCRALKRRMTGVLAFCDPAPTVKFCIAIEETEAFYLGDPEAIRKAFPAARLSRLKGRVPDRIVNAWEHFRDVISAQNENKVAWARAMAPHLGIKFVGRTANQSRSFRYFCKALRSLAGEP